MTARSLASLEEDARQYRRTLAHAIRVGLTVQQAQQVIGEALRIDVSAGRVTDWHGVCDRLTAVAAGERRAAEPPEVLPKVTVVVAGRKTKAGEVTSRG